MTPQRTTLSGRYVTLVPLDPDAHVDALWENVQDESLWLYLFDGPFSDRAALYANLEAKAASNLDGNPPAAR